MMPDPFSATEGELNAHWNSLRADILTHFNPAVADLTLQSERVGTQIFVGFGGNSAKRAERLRGGLTTAVHFTALSEDWSAWLGYREVWSYLDGPATRRRFYFSSSDLTVFLRLGDNGSFQQALRAEWSGVHKDEGAEWGFRPANAGHPHWQVDIGELIKKDDDLKAARALLLDSAPRDFGEEDVASISSPCWYNLGRMHLASGMRPWADRHIAHLPSRLGELRTWILDTLGLLRIELARL